MEDYFGIDDLSIEKNRIIGLIERGETEGVYDTIIKWTKDMEVKALISSKEMIRFNLERASLYEAVGQINDMFECLDEARYQTFQEMNSGNESGDWEGLLRDIENHIKEMEVKYPA